MNIKYKTKKQRQNAQNASIAKYQKKSMTAFTLRFHNESDYEIIKQLKAVNNKTDYIRQLILDDIRD